MMRLGRVSIRMRLILLVVLTAAPFLIIIVFDNMVERNRVLASVLARNAGVARLVAAEKNNLIVQAHALLSLLQQVPGVVDGGAGCASLLRQAIPDHAALDSLGLADADGTVICSSDPGPPQGFGDPAFFSAVMNEAAPSFMLSGLGRSAGQSRPILTAAMKLPGAAPRGVIFATLSLDEFLAGLDRVVPLANMRATLLDTRDGAILARRPADAIAVGQHIPPEGMQLLRNMRVGGSMIGPSVRAGDAARGYARLAEPAAAGLMVAISTPLEDVTADIRHRFQVNLAILAVAILVGGLLDWAMFELSMLGPMQAIQQIASRLSAGDLTARVQRPGWQGGEMRTLAKTLNVVAGRLQRAAAQNRVTLERSAQSEAEYRQIADNTGDMIFRLDLNLIRRYVSPASRRMLGYMPDELLGQAVTEIMHPDDVERAEPILQMLLAGTEWASISYRLRRWDGSYIWADANVRAIHAATGTVIGIIGTVRDVTDRHAAVAEVAASEARYRLLADYSSDLIFELDRNMHRLYVSPVCRTLLGYEPEELIGTVIVDFIHPDDVGLIAGKLKGLAQDDTVVDARYRYRHKDGHYIWVEARARRLPQGGGGGGGVIVTVRDLTDRLEIEQKLEAANRRLEVLALQDALTGLANRRRFDETLSLEFRRAERGMMPLSLILIDVDSFKRYNDTYGHQAGDACLQDVAQAVRHAVRRSSDLAARYGGEEMAVVLPDTEAAGAMVLAEQIRRAVRGLGRAHSASAAGVVTISLGVATVFPGFAYNDPAMLVAAADRALYRAKADGRDRAVEGALEHPAEPGQSPEGQAVPASG